MNKLFKLIILNVAFYLTLVPFSLIAVIAFTLFIAIQAPFIGHRGAMRLFRQAIRWYGYVVIHILPCGLVRVRHENQSGGQTPEPCIVVCNHRSSSDPFLMAVLDLPEIVQIVNTWPFHLPLWGPMARKAGYININAMAPDDFFKHAARMLSDNVSLVVFPEGTRTRNLKVGPFHSALFRLALQTRAPLVPLCISGNETIPPRGSMLLRPGLIRLRQLPALTWDHYKDLSPFQLKNKVRDLIAHELDVMEGLAT